MGLWNKTPGVKRSIVSKMWKMAKVSLITLLLVFAHNSYGQWRDTDWQTIEHSDIERYVEWLDGSFSSYQQSIEEPYFSHVVVDHRFIRHDQLGFWFYVQQGLFSDQPYRKRVYIVFQKNDTTIVTKSYRINDGANIHIKNKNIHTELSNITLDSLTYMPDCDSHIRMGINGYFYGSLANENCPGGTYNGATHTTSVFRVYPQMIVSWERGWRGDEQLWGSSRGYYYFRRVDSE